MYFEKENIVRSRRENLQAILNRFVCDGTLHLKKEAEKELSNLSDENLSLLLDVKSFNPLSDEDREIVKGVSKKVVRILEICEAVKKADEAGAYEGLERQTAKIILPIVTKKTMGKTPGLKKGQKVISKCSLDVFGINILTVDEVFPDGGFVLDGASYESALQDDFLPANEGIDMAIELQESEIGILRFKITQIVEEIKKRKKQIKLLKSSKIDEQ